MNSAKATTIAIIDSGTDLKHKELSSKKWVNPIDIDDGVDNDDNGYIDDLNGWNFAEQNNKLVDYKYLGTFSSDVYKFFEVQTRLLRGTGTQEDKDWIKAARNNEKLIGELGIFGNFVHGTHVAGISARNADNAKIMALKIMPTRSPIKGGGHFSRALMAQLKTSGGATPAIIKFALKALAAQQGKQLAPFGEYVGKEKARVANCSFGTSTNAAKGMLGAILKMALHRDPTEAELTEYAIFFVNEVVKAGVAMVAPAPKTLFVIAAGNDGMDNDQFPASPANVKRDNTITVAATMDYERIASFSNYGEKMVEVAAPGVGIESTIPGDLHLMVSGTSQAAPFVTNVAGLILDQNPKLSNAEVKAILMKTVDLKDFLKGKVTSAGIVNPKRAILAASLTGKMSLGEAIATARAQVRDVKMLHQRKSIYEGYVMPLPSLFN